MRRYIYTCECEPITSGGEPWVRIRIHGQSFLLNQIRKMVGLALAVYRGHAPADAIHLATDPQRNFGTPMAPELGLLLAECCFDAYNRNTGPEHGEVSLEQYSDAVETFKQVRCETSSAAVRRLSCVHPARGGLPGHVRQPSDGRARRVVPAKTPFQGGAPC